MSVSPEQWIRRYGRRIIVGQWFHFSALWLAYFLFLFGSAVLIVKLLLPQLWPDVVWLLLGLVPLQVLAGYWAYRRQFRRTDTVALLDRTINAGGLLMTLTELPDERWSEELPQHQAEWLAGLPKIRPVRFLRMLSLPLAFAVACCFVPLRQARTEPVRPGAVGKQATDELGELLESLEETVQLDEQEQQELREEIERLTEEVEKTPLTHEKWETVDALREQMRHHLESSAMRVDQALSAADALANYLNEDAGELSAEQIAQLQEQLESGLLQLSSCSGGKGSMANLPEGVRKKLQELAKTGQLPLSQLDPADLDQLREFLKQEQSKLSKLCKKCKGGGCCEGEGLCPSPGEALDRPGRGGISRGRGDAEMIWGDESDRQGVKFKETVLPPGFFDQPTNDVIRITKNAPRVEPAESAPRTAAKQTEAVSGNEAWNRAVRPRHRNVVRGYFSEKSSASAP